MIQEVDNYLNNLKKWQDELTKLRTLILNCDVTEAFKWMHPCYTYTNKNIVLIHGFKDYCALLFYKGALLKDPKNILIQQTKNVQAARQMRFTNMAEIEALESTIKSYILEAIEVEKKGLKIVKKKTTDYTVPEELKQQFEKDPTFKKAFKNLTPGRQRGYLLHFAKPQKAKSRFSRIEKNRERILNGNGLNDCVCGLSKRMPNCDGSHKQLQASH